MSEEKRKEMLKNLELRSFFEEVENCSECNKKLYCRRDVKCSVHMLSISITEKDDFKCIFKKQKEGLMKSEEKMTNIYSSHFFIALDNRVNWIKEQIQGFMKRLEKEKIMKEKEISSLFGIPKLTWGGSIIDSLNIISDKLKKAKIIFINQDKEIKELQKARTREFEVPNNWSKEDLKYALEEDKKNNKLK